MVVFKEEKWVVMDRLRKVISKGTSGSKALIFVDDPEDRKRVYFYNSEGTARAAIADHRYSWVWSGRVSDHFEQSYGPREGRRHNFIKDNLEPVKVLVTVEVVEETGEEDAR